MDYTQESLTELIFGVINNIFSKMYDSIDNTVYDILDRITFVDSSILEEKSFVRIFGEGSQNGILLICNSLLLGFFIYYAFLYLLSHLTYKQIQSPSQFFFKAVIFIALMNSSLWFCSEIINIVSLITKAISLLCDELFDVEVSLTKFNQMLNASTNSNDITFNVFSFNGIIKTFTTAGMLNLILTYSFRYIMIQVMVLICPFAILSMLSEDSECFFKSWFKNFLSILFVQIVLALMLLLVFSFDGIINETLKKLLYVGALFGIIRVNLFMKELIGGITFDVKQNLNMLRA